MFQGKGRGFRQTAPGLVLKINYMAENTGLVFKMYTDLTNYSKGLNKAGTQLEQFNGRISKVFGIMAGGVSAAGVIAFGNQAITAFDEAAKAEQRLRTALDGNEQAVARLYAQAAMLQSVTLFDDDATASAYAFLSTLHLSEDSIKKLMPLIQDFATVQKMDLAAAAELVGKSFMSSRNALKPYGIELDKTKTIAEQVDQAVKQMNERFGGQAQAAAQVGSASITQMKNAFGDFMEVVGGGTMNTLNPFFKSLTENLKLATEYMKTETIPWYEKLASLYTGTSQAQAMAAKYADQQGKNTPEGRLKAARENLEILRSTLQQEIASRDNARADLQERLAGLKSTKDETGLINDLKNQIAENEKMIANTYSVAQIANLRQQNELLQYQMEYYNSIGTSLQKMTAKGAGQIATNQGSYSMTERSGAKMNTDYGNDSSSLIELQNTANSAADIINSFQADLLVTAAEGFGQMLTGDMGLNQFFNNILMVTADFAKEFGALLISIGLARDSMKALNISGAGAIIAGFALIAAASAIKGLLSKGPNMPALATGTNYIPQDGPYYLHQGEAVVPKRYNAMGGAGMPATIRVVGSITGRDIRITQARENDYHFRTGRKI